MTKKIYTFGIIGCGRASRMHIESIDALAQAQLVAVCDTNVSRAQAVAGRYSNVEVYSDYRELLQDTNVDIVAICTPHNWHVSMGTDAALAGKHVIMEKPLGINVKEVSRMLSVFEEQKVQLFPVFQVRYNPPIKEVKHQLDSGVFGTLYHGALVVRWTRPQEYFDKDSWRGVLPLEGPLLFSQGSHYFDILRWYFGPVESVFAKKDTKGHYITIDDMVVGVITFKSGMILTFEFSLCTYPRNLECSLSILAEHASVKIGGQALNELEVWEVKDTPRPILAPGLPPNVYAGGMYQGSCPNHIYIYEAAIRHLDTGENDFITPDEALYSLDLVAKVYESATKGKEIKVYV